MPHDPEIEIHSDDLWGSGFYRLTADVANPSRVDRRRVDWNYQPIIPAGTRFALRRDLEFTQRIGMVLVRGQTPSKDASVTFNPPNPERSRFSALVAALKPHLIREEDTLASILWATHSTSDTIVRCLLQEGRLDLKGVKTMLQQKLQQELND